MKKINLILTVIFLFALQQITTAQFGFSKVEILKMKSYASFNKIHSGSEIKIAAKLNINNEWHINSNKPKEDFLIPTELKIKSDFNAEVEKILYPESKDIKLDFSDTPVSVFEGNVTIAAIVKIPENTELGKKQIVVEVSYQGCNNATCMAPSSVKDTLNIEIVGKNEQISEINSDIFSNINLNYTETESIIVDNDQNSLTNRLESSGLFLTLIIVFLGGLALNLTPCVYPLIPITIGFFGGQSEGKTSKLFLMGLFYVLGMALTYSVVGVITALSGAVFGTLMQNPMVIIFIVLIFVVLSLSMFGVYEFKLPDSLVAKAGGSKSGLFGAFFMGLTMGIVAAPCIGPFVIGLVTYVAAKGDPYYGFLLFFVMAIGLGLPYLILALFSGKIKSLPRAGFWMDAVKHIFGFILLGMAIYFLEPLLPKTIAKYLLPVFMIISAVILLMLDKEANKILGFRIFKVLFSGILFAVAGYMLMPVQKNSINWEKFSSSKYESALSGNKKIIIDFYADWCIPCKELDASTFSNEDVIKLSQSFKAFKVDMTKTLSDETENIRKKFDIRGMPTVLIFNSNGKEVNRITGFVNAQEFLKMIESVN